jgi:cytoskeleton protein RodZ
MDSQVGTILRQARNRRKVELSEVEAATRIRLRYLRAIEDEDWDVLPGGVYTRGFIRTYGSFLGLDGERLAQDYRASVEADAEAGGVPGSAAPSPGIGAPKSPRRLRFGWLIVASGVVLLAAAIVALLPSGSDDVEHGHGHSQGNAQSATQQKSKPGTQPGQGGVSLQLIASAEVWVCLLDGRDQPLVDGQILEAGAEAGPFRSGSFTVSFGNGEVSMMVDGSEAEIPATSSPVGYSIDLDGKLTELSETERPTCA